MKTRLLISAFFIINAAVSAQSKHVLQTEPEEKTNRQNIPANRSLKIEWQFDIKEDENGVPKGKIYLLINGKKTLILADATENYSVIERKDYKRNEIPATAVSAIFGWFAGQGKTLYAVRSKTSVVVFIKYEDEGAPDFPFKRLKTIHLDRQIK